ncbi:glycosyltransferase family 4 protein [Bifidobacterium sp. ESL0798]|uniref:glycosyltransferase family 4 protein n=1 Tax=Bifidobacterium sp. ESL0798 TaxID=2983235 RepID=UPI0023FA2D15|nr:glycosyltransferase family 4 protein [Bifidobacterium sp. ESL0798]WEV73871.1 glycosyltransferase family 4 protein [Bifidobacterium sp. ESL0798]
MCDFFRISAGDQGKLDSLSERLRRLVVGAMNYNALIQPGRTLVFKLYMGQKWQYPRLTDLTTLNGLLTSKEGLEPFEELSMTSTVEPGSAYPPQYFDQDQQVVDTGVRYLLLTPDGATDKDVESKHPNDGPRAKLYNALELSFPTQFDVFRDTKRSIREYLGRKPVKPWIPRTVERENAWSGHHHPVVEIKPGKAPAGAKKAVIIAMHWFQAGGAERWALETVKLVKQAGLYPIVITDRDGHQPWITRPEFDDALLLPLTAPLQERPGDAPLLRALFEHFDIKGILIHHCQWMYDRAWWVKKYFPRTKIVDSLHIVEYFFRGGYPHESAIRDQWIDLHHVISPQLRHWLVDIHHLDAKKVIVAPLVGLTVDSEKAKFKPRDTGKPLTVAFVGRMVRQKRPEAFILTAHALQRAYPGKFRFIMQGNGDMDIFADTLIKRYNLGKVLERRSMKVPVAKTYEDADVLLVSSINEGITLTTIEALSAGIPVISADVGSQSTLVPKQGLLRRMTSKMVHDAKSALAHLANSEDERKRLWTAEENRLEKFSQLESADALFARMLKGWNK